MGYTTDFYGEFTITPPLTSVKVSEINEFSQKHHDAPGFPGIWCDWEVTKDNLFWKGNEKFYHYAEWFVIQSLITSLDYLIDNFFSEWGRKLSGEIEWRGEDLDDMGCLRFDANGKLQVLSGSVKYE